MSRIHFVKISQLLLLLFFQNKTRLVLNLFKPKTNYQVQISTPCQEDWDKMTEAKKGKFCASCSKTVVDFSLMSDQQIIDYFLKHKTKICGNFRNEQLDRKLILDKTKKISVFSKCISYALFLFNLIPQISEAQSKPKTPFSIIHTDDSSYSSHKEIITKSSKSKVIKGRVYDRSEC
ncbi:MAG: hypothetical protein R2852_09700 [Bacteroidia bacterium]